MSASPQNKISDHTARPVHDRLLFLLALLCLVSRPELTQGAAILGESKPVGSSLWTTAYTTRPGEKEEIGFGAGSIIPELHMMPEFSRFSARFAEALMPEEVRTNKTSVRPPYRVLVNTMVEKQFETKNRLDLKGWVLSMLVHGRGAFLAVDPHLSQEELAYQEAFRLQQEYYAAEARATTANSSLKADAAPIRPPLTAQALLDMPALVIEAEVAAFDEGVMSKNTGVHVDFLIGVSGPKTNLQVEANPSLGFEKSLSSSTLLIHARVKRFSQGRYIVGGSAIIAATLADRGQNVDLGLWMQGSGGGFRNQVNIKPAVQQAILRCTSRAVMVALGRALDIPYWYVLPEFPEDALVQEGLRARLAGLKPEANREVLAQIKAVLENPLAEPAEHHREDVNAILDAIAIPARGASVSTSSTAGADITVELVGFAEADRYRLVGILEAESGARAVRNQGWIYRAAAGRQLACQKDREQWAARLCQSVPKISGTPCRVMELTPNQFRLVNLAGY